MSKLKTIQPLPKRSWWQTANTEESLIRPYQIYNKIDWLVFFAVLAITVGPVILATIGYRIGVNVNISVGGLAGILETITSLPLLILIPFIIAFTFYNVWSI